MRGAGDGVGGDGTVCILIMFLLALLDQTEVLRQVVCPGHVMNAPLKVFTFNHLGQGLTILTRSILTGLISILAGLVQCVLFVLSLLVVFR